MKKTLPVAAVYAITALVFTWFLTNGNFHLFAPESYGSVYDSMAAHMWHFSPEVDRNIIAGEAFIRDGHTYAYFLPAPALPRMLLNLIFPGMFGLWTRVSILLAAMLSVWAALQLLDLAAERRMEHLRPLFATAAGLGATTLVLTSRAYLYHEAIAWGACLALLSVVYTLRFWRDRRMRQIVCAGVFAALAFFSRPTAGMGPLLLLCISAALVWKKPRLAMVPAGILLLTTAMFLAYNQARFGGWFDSVPIRLHVQYTPQRLEHIGGTLVHPADIPANAFAYLLAPNLAFTPAFPWIAMRPGWPKETEARKYDWIEPHLSVLVSMPALFLLMLLGFGVRKHTLLLLPMAAATLPLFAVAATAERYVHDLFPLLVIAASVGLVFIAEIVRRNVWVRTCLWIGVLWSVTVMSALTFVAQREQLAGIPNVRRLQLQSISRTMDNMFSY